MRRAPPAGAAELAAFETDVLAGFVLARAAAGLADATIRSDVVHLEQLRAWFGGPLRDMEPADADAYFGRVMRDAAKVWVPRTSSTSCDQSVFVDYPTDTGLFSDLVLLKIDRFGERFQRRS